MILTIRRPSLISDRTLTYSNKPELCSMSVPTRSACYSLFLHFAIAGNYAAARVLELYSCGRRYDGGLTYANCQRLNLLPKSLYRSTHGRSMYIYVYIWLALLHHANRSSCRHCFHPGTQFNARVRVQRVLSSINGNLPASRVRKRSGVSIVPTRTIRIRMDTHRLRKIIPVTMQRVTRRELASSISCRSENLIRFS